MNKINKNGKEKIHQVVVSAEYGNALVRMVNDRLSQQKQDLIEEIERWAEKQNTPEISNGYYNCLTDLKSILNKLK